MHKILFDTECFVLLRKGTNFAVLKDVGITRKRKEVVFSFIRCFWKHYNVKRKFITRKKNRKRFMLRSPFAEFRISQKEGVWNFRLWRLQKTIARDVRFFYILGRHTWTGVVSRYWYYGTISNYFSLTSKRNSFPYRHIRRSRDWAENGQVTDNVSNTAEV